MLVVPPTNVVRVFHPALVDFLNRAMRVQGVRLATSWYRDPRVNARVGGSPESQHLVGLAVDLVGDSDTIVETARAAGLIAVDEGDHVHLQAWPKGRLGSLFAQFPTLRDFLFA